MGDLKFYDCLICLDDIIINSSSFEDHFYYLEEVFTIFKHHSLKTQASKCEIHKLEVTYLVMWFSKVWSRLIQKKIDALSIEVTEKQ